MRNSRTFLVILLSIFALNNTTAQKSDSKIIVVTKGQDSISGKRISYRLFGEDSLVVKKKKGEEDVSIAVTDVMHYFFKGAKYQIITLSNSKGELKDYTGSVIVDGKVKLLLSSKGSSHLYYVLIDDAYYRVSRRHFSNTVWSKLSACKEFNQEFFHYYNANKTKKTAYE